MKTSTKEKWAAKKKKRKESETKEQRSGRSVTAFLPNFYYRSEKFYLVLPGFPWFLIISFV